MTDWNDYVDEARRAFDAATSAAELDEPRVRYLGRRSELKQADGEISKTQAQFRIQEQQAQTDLTKARYDVRRAELDAVPSEFLPRMEREQKELALKDAKARLAEAERRLKAIGDIEKAELGSKIQKRDKSRFDMEHAERQLGGLEIKAPVDGVVAIMPGANHR